MAGLVPAIHVFNKVDKKQDLRGCPGINAGHDEDGSMRLPREIGPIHFVGIGGIGMSGIAEVLCNLGYTVRARMSPTAPMSSGLRDKGIKVAIGHKADNSTAPTWSWSRPRSNATIRN